MPECVFLHSSAILRGQRMTSHPFQVSGGEMWGWEPNCGSLQALLTAFSPVSTTLRGLH